MNQFYIKFVVLYQIFAIVPNPAVVSKLSVSQPAPKPPIARPIIPNAPKPIAPIAPSSFQPISELQTIPVAPAPTPAQNTPPAASASGCVTGYASGDYYLDKIIAFESSGNSCATNPGGCFGLLQACPGEPLRAACGGDPACQIAWFQDPANHKTGGRSWAQVWQHELDFGWW